MDKLLCVDGCFTPMFPLHPSHLDSEECSEVDLLHAVGEDMLKSKLYIVALA